MKRMILFLVLPALLLSQGKRPLTIDEAIRLGIDNSKSLKVALAKVAGAQAKFDETRAARLLAVKLQAGYQRLSEIDPFDVQLPFSPNPIQISPVVLNNYSTRLSFTQPIFTGWKLSKLVDAASFIEQASYFDAEKEKVELVYNIKQAYWGLFKLIEVKRVIDENIEQIRAHLSDVQNMMSQGMATKSDLLKVQVQLSSTELSQIDSDNSVRLAMMGLNSFLALPLDTEIITTSKIETGEHRWDSLAVYVEQAHANRDDIKAAEMRIHATDASVFAARGGRFPQIHLYGNYVYARPNPRILPARDEFVDTWDVGVTLSFDVWNWGMTTYQSQQAEAALSQTRYIFEALKDVVTLDVHQSYFSLIQMKGKVNVAEKGMELAEENFRIAKNKFAFDIATNTDLLDAEVTLLQAQLNHTIAVVDYELAHAKLLQAIGRVE